MLKCDQLVGRLRDRATALFGGKIRIVVATKVSNTCKNFITYNIEAIKMLYCSPNENAVATTIRILPPKKRGCAITQPSTS